MKTFVQFLVRDEKNNAVPLKSKNEIQLLDERKTLNSQIVDSFDHIEKHEQMAEIVGFNIVEIETCQGNQKETIVHQNIFDF